MHKLLMTKPSYRLPTYHVSIWLLGLPLLLIVVTGCSNTAGDRKGNGGDSATRSGIDSGTIGSGDILLLVAGNRWEYATKFRDQAGERFTFSVSGKRKLPSGEEVFELNQPWLLGKNGAYIRNGTLYGVRIDSAALPAEVVYPSNPEVGDKWVVDGDTVTYLLADTTLQVVAGKFRCAKLGVGRSRQQGAPPLYIYWSRGVGIVRATDEVEMVSELVGYRIR